MHQGHKLLEIYNEESLRKENITIEENSKEIEKDINKMNNIKEKIENEITNINNTYDKIYTEITQSFIKKHEKLIKEENELVEKLQNEVTKIKENLEICLSQANQVVKVSERISKGIKSIENDNKNIINYLYTNSKVKI